MNKNFSFMAFSTGKESSEGGNIKRYIGVAPVKVVATNPSKSELEAIYNTTLDKAPEYTGTQEFKCLNGWVYPGTRFYLVGEVKLKDGEGGDQDSQGRVFTQDHTTTIQMTVTSLEKAYNVLPSILAKNLEIGVKTTPMWTAATPGSVIME